MSETVPVFGPVQPRIRKVDLDRPWIWIAAGWNDLLRAPRISLAYGALLAAISLALALALWLANVFYLLLPLTAGFALVAPLRAWLSPRKDKYSALIDLTLAGDNAIVVGMAASRVHPSMRAKVIFWGIAGAVVLRILFSGIAQQMLQVIGLTLAGGLLLLFVSWKMYRQIIEGSEHSIEHVESQLDLSEWR